MAKAHNTSVVCADGCPLRFNIIVVRPAAAGAAAPSYMQGLSVAPEAAVELDWTHWMLTPLAAGVTLPSSTVHTLCWLQHYMC